MADHCQSFTLSDPDNGLFQKKCNHDHVEICCECYKLNKVHADIEIVCSKLLSEEEREDTMCMLQHAKDAIMAWKVHQLRSVTQDQAKFDVLDILNRDSALLVMDWAMKYLPRKFRESQCDWFAKRGIPWHITVVLTSPDQRGPLERLTILHVFESCPQDSVTVTAILQDVLVTIKEQRPELETVYCKQDNAGCYHCGSTIVGSTSATGVLGVKVERFDFSDRQGGKGEADRQAATIKGHISIWRDSWLSVKYVRIPELSSNKPMIKWEGISALNNFQFHPSGVQAWKAYKIGPRKLFPWSDIQSDSSSPCTMEVLESPAQTQRSCFRVVRARQTRRLPEAKVLVPLAIIQKAWKTKKRWHRKVGYSVVQKRVVSIHFNGLRHCRHI